MSILAAFITATFTIPENISVTPQSMLWLLPLVASISIVYKATKMPKIKAAEFTKEVAILFSSIIVFMAVTAFALCVISWLIIE